MAQEKAGQAAPVRVVCTLENAGERINGVRFVALPSEQDAPVVRVSEPVSERVAHNFLRFTTGYRLATSEEVAAHGAGVDEQLAALAAAEAERADSGEAALGRQVTELQNANQAITAERNALQDELARIKREKGPVRLGELEAEVRALRTEVERLTTENGDLRQANAALADGGAAPARRGKREAAAA